MMEADRETAEFAATIADPWQGKGLGEKLITRAIEIARENGVKVLRGDVLAANAPMLGLMKKLGFIVHPREEERMYWVELAL